MNEGERERRLRERAAARSDDERTKRYPGQRPERSGVAKKLLPLAVLIFIAAMIARKEVPVVDEWWQRTFHNRDWTMQQNCARAALAQSAERQFSRVIDEGKLHQTEDGYYLDGLLLGEKGADGAEQRIYYSCYLDTEGQLVNVTRHGPGRPAAP